MYPPRAVAHVNARELLLHHRRKMSSNEFHELTPTFTKQFSVGNGNCSLSKQSAQKKLVPDWLLGMYCILTHKSICVSSPTLVAVCPIKRFNAADDCVVPAAASVDSQSPRLGVYLNNDLSQCPP